MIRAEILDTAKKMVTGQREQDYGTPEANFGIIGKLWTDYLDHMVTAEDVANMMILFKVARNRTGRGKADTWVDIAGYAACGGEIATDAPVHIPPRTGAEKKLLDVLFREDPDSEITEEWDDKTGKVHIVRFRDGGLEIEYLPKVTDESITTYFDETPGGCWFKLQKLLCDAETDEARAVYQVMHDGFAEWMAKENKEAHERGEGVKEMMINDDVQITRFQNGHIAISYHGNLQTGPDTAAAFMGNSFDDVIQEIKKTRGTCTNGDEIKILYIMEYSLIVYKGEVERENH